MSDRFKEDKPPFVQIEIANLPGLFSLQTDSERQRVGVSLVCQLIY